MKLLVVVPKVFMSLGKLLAVIPALSVLLIVALGGISYEILMWNLEQKKGAPTWGVALFCLVFLPVGLALRLIELAFRALIYSFNAALGQHPDPLDPR